MTYILWNADKDKQKDNNMTNYFYVELSGMVNQSGWLGVWKTTTINTLICHIEIEIKKK